MEHDNITAKGATNAAISAASVCLAVPAEHKQHTRSIDMKVKLHNHAEERGGGRFMFGSGVCE